MLQKNTQFFFSIIQLSSCCYFVCLSQQSLTFFPFPPCYNKSVGDFFSRKQVDLALVDASFVSHISFQFLYKPSKLSLMHFWSVVRALFYRHITVCNMYFYGAKYIFVYNKLLHLVLEWSVSCHKTNRHNVMSIIFLCLLFQLEKTFFSMLSWHYISEECIACKEFEFRSVDRAFYTVFR